MQTYPGNEYTFIQPLHIYIVTMVLTVICFPYFFLKNIDLGCSLELHHLCFKTIQNISFLIDYFHFYKKQITVHLLRRGVLVMFQENMSMKNIPPRTPFLAHLSRRLIGELIVYPCSGVRPSSVRPSSVRRPQFQRSSSLKPLGRLFSYYTYTIYR